jgi:hypothetical protein
MTACGWAAAAVFGAGGFELLHHVGHGNSALFTSSFMRLAMARRHLARADQAVPGGGLEAGEAGLGHGRHVGVAFGALQARLRDGDGLAALHVRRGGRHGVEAVLHLAADQVGEHRAGALVRHVDRLDAGLQHEHLQRQVLGRAGAGGAEAHLARVGLAQRDQVLHRLGRLVSLQISRLGVTPTS